MLPRERIGVSSARSRHDAHAVGLHRLPVDERGVLFRREVYDVPRAAAAAAVAAAAVAAVAAAAVRAAPQPAAAVAAAAARPAPARAVAAAAGAAADVVLPVVLCLLPRARSLAQPPTRWRSDDAARCRADRVAAAADDDDDSPPPVALRRADAHRRAEPLAA